MKHNESKKKLSRVNEVDKKNSKYDAWFQSAIGALLIVLVYIGLIYGLIQFARSKEPNQEGQTILILVVGTILLMVLVAIVFLFAYPKLLKWHKMVKRLVIYSLVTLAFFFFVQNGGNWQNYSALLGQIISGHGDFGGYLGAILFAPVYFGYDVAAAFPSLPSSKES